MGNSVRAGLIGTGMISQHAHIPAWSVLDGVDIVGIADPDKSARAGAQTCLRKHGHLDVSEFSDYEALVNTEDLDFVDITIPAGEAKESAIHTALENGLHVTCQKPFVTEYRTGQQLAEKADAVDQILSVNQQARYAGAFTKAKSLISHGDLGTLRTVRISSDLPFAGKERRVAFSVHNFDLLRYWAGREPVRVNAWHKRQTSDDRYVFATWIEFEDELMAQVWDELSSSTTLRWQFRLGGSEGTVRGHEAYKPEMIPPEVVYTPAGKVSETVTPITTSYVPDAFIGYFEQFVAAVRENEPAPTTAEDNLRSLRIAFAARQSADQGDWISLEDFEP
ncbi:Gfo/Idh/MocA family protein [Halobellus marinus]|uniref:Gfo/Idh/MocA family protein n=1 Tax=Halobellus TaxID=1073986 RepID=UPI0028A919C2|nr:Gfo/Idh/MocA family oxidoreductase [Halobellus sp. DFY28]